MQADITQGPRANEAKSIEISILTCGINKSTSVLTAPTAKIIIGMSKILANVRKLGRLHINPS